MTQNQTSELEDNSSAKNGLIASLNLDLPNLNYENSLQRYLAEINKIPSLSQEEEFLLAKAFLENADKNAANRLVTSHLKLVAKIAMSYRNYGLPINEMISEGNIGLIHAVKKYDPSLGFRLSTYAMWWIKAHIQDYVLKSWSLVKIGTTAAQKKLFFSLSKLKNKISYLYSRNVNDQDYESIARDLGVSKKDVLEANERLYLRDVSLNQCAQGGDESTAEMIDFLPDTGPSQEVLVSMEQESRLRKDVLVKGLESLSQRELYIIKSRKLKEPADTLETLSNKFHISKERVRQIENRAFEKLKVFVLDKFNQPFDSGSAA